MTLINAFKTLGIWLDPLRQALFAPNIPFDYRWRLLILQQLTLIVIPLKTLPWIFSRAYRTIWIPSRGKHTLRGLVFEPKKSSPSQRSNLRPLHIDFHSGGFAGGTAEGDIAFCHEVCTRTGAVVVSVDYRVAPQNVYPAAHEDCEDAVAWLLANAKEKFHADPNCLTVSGFSAGGNAMMVAGNRAKAAVGMYGAVSLSSPRFIQDIDRITDKIQDRPPLCARGKADTAQLSNERSLSGTLSSLRLLRWPCETTTHAGRANESGHQADRELAGKSLAHYP